MSGQRVEHAAPDGVLSVRITPCEMRMIERARTAMGAQQVTQIARRLSMNHESVRRYLLGTTTAPAIFLLRIAENFDIDGHWLLTGEADTHLTLRTASTTQLLNEIKRRAEKLGGDLSSGHARAPSEWEQVALLCAASTPGVASAEQRAG